MCKFLFEPLFSVLLGLYLGVELLGKGFPGASVVKNPTALPSKSLQAINAREGVEKREPSYPVGGNAN